MKIFCWNCRGAGNSLTVQALQNWSGKLCPDIIFLSETMSAANKMERLGTLFGLTNSIGVSSIGRAGGLVIYWKDEIDFQLRAFSNNFIEGDIMEGNVLKMRFIGLYGWPETSNKSRTWELIRARARDTQIPTIIGGDFNEILSMDEKWGGVVREQRVMDDFRDTLMDCNLRDLGYSGAWYTWQRGRSTTTCIRERLDRFVANDCWASLFPEAHVENLLRFRSDHAPILLHTERANLVKWRTDKCFKFEKLWLENPECEEIVRKAWSKGFAGNAVMCIAECTTDLEEWSDSTFGDIKRKITILEKDLKQLQKRDVTTAHIDRCILVEAQLDELYKQQESLWFMRSRVSEIKDGDKNTP